jgi:hypothetical protein
MWKKGRCLTVPYLVGQEAGDQACRAYGLPKRRLSHLLLQKSFDRSREQLTVSDQLDALFGGEFQVKSGWCLCNFDKEGDEVAHSITTRQSSSKPFRATR